LGIAFLDTGATYRAVTLAGMRRGIDLADEAALAQVARTIDLRMSADPQGLRVTLDGQDVTREIRTAAVTDNSRFAARAPRVREVLVDLQRRLGQDLGSFVTEGRDQGTVVFPHAEAKFYLDASPEIRARRRLADLQAAGDRLSYEEVLAAINDRDQRDRGRSVAPLMRPADAVCIDTSNMTFDEVTQTMLRHLEGRR
jgi:cytidylate kinase